MIKLIYFNQYNSTIIYFFYLLNLFKNLNIAKIQFNSFNFVDCSFMVYLFCSLFEFTVIYFHSIDEFFCYRNLLSNEHTHTHARSHTYAIYS